MSRSALDVLHGIHTATNDMLKGYREMAARAEPDIQAVIHRLIDLHEGHAAEQTAELARAGEAGQDDSSLQGALNKAVVIVRDWVSDLDRDSLPAVREGEEWLREKYDDALEEQELASLPVINALLRRQRDSINSEIARLPRK